VPWRQAGWWAVFTSMPQLIFALLAWWFVSVFEWFLPVGLGFAAGSMVWLGIREVLWEALELAKNKEAVKIFTIFLALLVVLIEFFSK